LVIIGVELAANVFESGPAQLGVLFQNAEKVACFFIGTYRFCWWSWALARFLGDRKRNPMGVNQSGRRRGRQSVKATVALRPEKSGQIFV